MLWVQGRALLPLMVLLLGMPACWCSWGGRTLLLLQAMCSRTTRLH
jgi:hypothetical protein